MTSEGAQKEQVAYFGGWLALSISVALAVSLPLRNVDYNGLNMFTMIAGLVAGILAIRSSRRGDRQGLGWAIVLLVASMVPSMYGWAGLLYIPALVALISAAVHFIIRAPDA